jgi:pilus assembly protein Flp/PilA
LRRWTNGVAVPSRSASAPSTKVDVDQHMTSIQLMSYRLLVGLRARTARQEGQALIEYALIISLIALVAIAALQTMGGNIKGVLNTIAGEV